MKQIWLLVLCYQLAVPTALATARHHNRALLCITSKMPTQSCVYPLVNIGPRVMTDGQIGKKVFMV